MAARPSDPNRLPRLAKFAAVQVAIAHVLRTLPPNVVASVNVNRLHAALSGTVAMILVGYKGEYTPSYRKLLGDHMAPRHSFGNPDELHVPCDKIHEGEDSCSKALADDLPVMAKRVARFYLQLYLVQAVIGIAARGRGKVDWDALKRLPTNYLGSVAFFLSFATLQRLATCYLAPRPVRDNLLAYGLLTAVAARIANNFEAEARLVGISKLLVGYIAQEFLPGSGILYLIGIAMAHSLEISPAADVIAGTIAANFQ